MKAVIIAKNLILLVIILVMLYSAAVLIRHGEFHEDVFVVLEYYFPYLLTAYVIFKIVQEIGVLNAKSNKK